MQKVYAYYPNLRSYADAHALSEIAILKEEKVIKNIVVLIAGACLLAACQLGNKAVRVTEAADITGIWWQLAHPHYDPAYMIIRSDGTYTFASNPEGQHGESGKYWFDSGYFMISDAGCPNPGKYKLTTVDQNPPTLTFSLVEDDCPVREGILTTHKAIQYTSP